MPESVHQEGADEARVAPGARVTLHFSLALQDGSMIDSNYQAQPATFVVGDGNLLPGFEAALMGLQAGAKLNVVLPATEAFGEVQAGNIQTLPRHKFSGLLANNTDPVEPGTVLSFKDGGGHEIPGVVQKIDEDALVVDFNHPLAGRDIVFCADIISVIPPGVQAVRIQ